MRFSQPVPTAIPVSTALLVVAACGGSQPAGSSTLSGSTAASGQESTDDAAQREPGEDNEFQLRESETAGDAHGERPSEIEPTETEAALRFFVIDKDEGPIEGIVIKMTAPDGTEFFTKETDSVGYAEVLVPVGQAYELEYLSLGRRNVTASVEVPAEPNKNIKLTLRYKWHDRARGEGSQPRFVLEGIHFDSGRATIRPDSHARLDRVVEYMTHRRSVRVRIEGHTDNVGNARRNQALSERRAQAVREYLISQGIDGSRIEAVGYGPERPIASNDTEEGRQKNRRIEAIEL